MCRTMAIQNDNLAPEGESLCTADGSNWKGNGIIAYSWQTRPGLRKRCISPDSSSTAHYSNCELCYSTGCGPGILLCLNTEETSLGCLESINAHSLQTSQSHVLVAWMVSPTDSENNLIIIVLSGSGSSETRLEPSDSPAMLI